MTHDAWTAVDRYIDTTLVGADAALDAAVAASVAAGMPQIHVSASQGKLLHLLARAMGARRILEIGTLAGYSTIWLARALPAGGRVVTIEYEPRHAEVARANFARAGVADRIELRTGRAADVLAALAAEHAPPFDLTFIDADKPGLADYVRATLALSRPGSMIVADNVVRDGKVADAASADAAVQGVRRMHDAIAAEPRLDATAIQTVGSKGWDGFTLAVVG